MFRSSTWLLTFFIAFVHTVHAEQRKYVVGTSLDLAAGATNRLTSTGVVSNQNQPLFLFYGAFPTITMASTGARSLLNASYSYGLNRSKSQQSFGQHSHSASLNFSTPLTSQLGISFTDSFQSTSDAASFNALRGVTANPPSPFVFYPVAAQILSRTNSSNAGVNYRFSDRSSVGLNVSHHLRTYGTNGQNVFSGALLNQQNISVAATYNWQASQRETWTVAYTSGYATFKNFENAYSDTAHMGYSNEIRPDLRFNLTVGLASVKSQGTLGSYIGYNTSVNLQKTLQANSLSLFYTQTSGQSSGLGSVSDTRIAGFAWNHKTRTVTEFADISFFDTKGLLGNSFNARGLTAAANIGMPLSRRWSLQGGGQYQHYNRKSAFGFTQKRLFVSLRYSEPTLWSFFR